MIQPLCEIATVFMDIQKIISIFTETKTYNYGL